MLPRPEVDKLLDSRTRYGVKAKVSGEPGCPVAADETMPDRPARLPRRAAKNGFT